MEDSRAARPGSGAEEFEDEDFTTRIRALGAFHAEHLTERAPYRFLARHAGVSPTTVSDWLRGERFPQDAGKLKAVVRALRAAALQLGIAEAEGEAVRLLDAEEWARVHRAEAARRAGTVGHAVLRAQARAVLARAQPARTEPARTEPARTEPAPAPAAGLLPALAAPPTPRRTDAPPVPGARRVEDWNPRHLGVKPAVEVPGAPGDLPLYIPRDHDHVLRRALRETRAAGGMLLLVGEPSTGKSRSAHEAVRAELPGWWLLRPKDTAALEELADAAPPAAPGLVVWLDDLDRFLSAHPTPPATPLSAHTLVRLLDPGRPTIVVAALWPDQYDRHSNPERADEGRGDEPGNGAPSPARDILALAVTVDVAEEFSDSERERSRKIAEKDPRVAAAIQVSDFGVVQTLAGAPVLERRWCHGNVYGRALIDAAIDARRLGSPDLVTAAFLRAAAPGYIGSTAWARATEQWWEDGLRHATKRVDGATAALSPRAGTEPGSVVGYTLADHLLHVGSRRRRLAPVPETTWRALLATSAPHDLVRIGWSAEWRLLYELADTFYAAAGPDGAVHRARLLRTRGRTAASRALLESLAADGHHEAITHLVQEHTHGKAEEDDHEGRIARLRPYASFHDGAAEALAGALEAAGQRGEAIVVWRRLAEAGDVHAARRAAQALDRDGRREEALALLREHAGRHSDLREELARLLLGDGTAPRVAEAERLLRTWFAQDPRAYACDELLAGLLDDAGRLDDLQELATHGSQVARGRLTRHWVARAVEEPEVAAHALALCAEWKPSPYGPWAELHLCRELGLLEEAWEFALGFERDHGSNDDLDAVVAELLVDAGRWEDVVARADAGNWRAQQAIARTLVEQGRIAELEARAAHGDGAALDHLCRTLEHNGRADEAVALWRRARAAGDEQARTSLIGLLERLGREEELLALLREETRPLGKYDARRLAQLLVKRGLLAELADRAAAGDVHADTELVHHLADAGRFDDLRRRAVAGSGSATRALPYAAEQEPVAAAALRGLTEYGLRLDGTVAAPREGG
ncbi:hypothetical protein [Streptomyces vilmorinianum]|uniref:hypothetical protein n=1 Tax=Streptomyces vilmorinianum TaxID=3051092 RepID=UPI0015860D18|nr:hypothetical protein [Streptomyces vilmorinianum]